ncbi:MAG TPA: hypothetical protein VJ724_10210 [Tahibacter sp.]|nr:hypothetical protein [Tahibacter sp.]
MTPRLRLTLVPVAAAIAAAAALSLQPVAVAAYGTPTYLAKFPYFNPQLSTDLPGDVDTALKKQLENKQEFAKVQRLFDLWSWQAFITLNWPVNNAGKFAPKLSDTGFGAPKWTTWYESPSIFRQDGGVPAACASGAKTLLSLTRENLPVARDLAAFALPSAFDKRKTRLLGNISAVGDISPATRADQKLDEITQAFTAPLIDQNGNYAFYEIMLDPNEVGYVCTYKLYNIEGQVAFTGGSSAKAADLPRGNDAKDGSGAWELKLAWRIMTAGDDRTRFMTSEAIVPPTNGKCPDGTASTDQCPVTVGLVGMHIAHKSDSSPQWIWSTFEQVDNLSVDNVAHPKLKPSFFDPNCEICVPNVAPAETNGVFATSPPTQVSRAIPIPADKVALNIEAQVALAKAGSALRYYQLIDTQWPTSPSTPPANPADGLPNAVENKPGGNPTPVFLTNITMETYFQVGTQPACQQEENQSNCPAASWLTASQKAGQVDDTTPIFGTESCMGCHSSAGLYTSYDAQTGATTTSGQLKGDFSWLFTQKAQAAKKP